MKVGWILCDGIMGASSREIGFNINTWFNSNGVNSEIIYEAEGTVTLQQSLVIEEAIKNKEITHLIFQKVCAGKAPNYLNLAKENGITTIYTVDDFLGDYSKHMDIQADILVTNSNFMKEFLWAERHRKAIHIPSAYEAPRELCRKDYKTEQIKVFWFGSLGNAAQAQDLQSLIESMGYKYEILSSPPIATKQWTLTYYNDLIQADIMVIPCLHSMTIMEKAKGENRPVSAMTLGVPVIVSPFPSYMKLIRNGETGFICYSNTIDEFQMYLGYLKDEKIRETIGKAGRQRVVEEYNIEAIGRKWREIL